MAPSYGTFKRTKTASPSSSGAIKAAIATSPHANLIPPDDGDAQRVETTRRSKLYNEVRELFHDGLLGHEILEHFPEERHWMQDKMGEWEVVFRREQIQFIENRDKPAPTFSKPVPQTTNNNDYLPLPALEVDKPHVKAVGIKAIITRSDTGEEVEELVWIPRSQIKDGKASRWIVDKKREELEVKYPIQSIENFPE